MVQRNPLCIRLPTEGCRLFHTPCCTRPYFPYKVYSELTLLLAHAVPPEPTRAFLLPCFRPQGQHVADVARNWTPEQLFGSMPQTPLQTNEAA